jgi:hypothetical protein
MKLSTAVFKSLTGTPESEKFIKPFIFANDLFVSKSSRIKVKLDCNNLTRMS